MSSTTVREVTGFSPAAPVAPAARRQRQAAQALFQVRMFSYRGRVVSAFIYLDTIEPSNLSAASHCSGYQFLVALLRLGKDAARRTRKVPV
eukprot:9065272-Pyramimonas_sp.AAC.2